MPWIGSLKIHKTVFLKSFSYKFCYAIINSIVDTFEVTPLIIFTQFLTIESSFFGHFHTHFPHLRQTSLAITHAFVFSFTFIALYGQTFWHIPQYTHFSLLFITLPFNLTIFLNNFNIPYTHLFLKFIYKII